MICFFFCFCFFCFFFVVGGRGENVVAVFSVKMEDVLLREKVVAVFPVRKEDILGHGAEEGIYSLKEHRRKLLLPSNKFIGVNKQLSPCKTDNRFTFPSLSHRGKLATK